MSGSPAGEKSENNKQTGRLQEGFGNSKKTHLTTVLSRKAAQNASLGHIHSKNRPEWIKQVKTGKKLPSLMNPVGVLVRELVRKVHRASN